MPVTENEGEKKRMKDTLLISVIVPVYNKEIYLEECVDSDRAQTYENIEILLVNDGSTDGSKALCESYERKDKRIRVLSKENGGLMSAWIHGLKEAKGEYICFVDSDDWIDPDMLEKLAEGISGNDREVICSNYIIEKTDKKQQIKVTQGLKAGVYEREEIEKNLIPNLLGKEIRRIHSSRCMKLISVKLLRENLCFTDKRITMGEDLNIMYPVFLDVRRIVILEEGYFYHYRFVDSSMVHKYNPKLYDKIKILYQALKKVILTKYPEGERQKELLEGLKKEYVYLLLLVLKNELRGPNEGRVERIQKIVTEAKDEGLKGTVIDVTSGANRLIYQIWKHPDRIRIWGARGAVWVFDRR